MYIYNNKLITYNNKPIRTLVQPPFIQPPFNGLVSYWRFDETSGTIAYDSVGGNNGTATSASLLDSTGKKLSGIKLDNQHYIDYGNVLNTWTTAQPYSVSVWVKRNTSSNSMAIILSNLESSNSLFDIHVSYENLYFLIQRINSSNRALVQANSAVPYSNLNWNHYVFTYNGDRNANNMKVYKNGVEYTNRGITNTLSWTGALGGNLQTGRRGGTTYVTDFQLDELGLWNRALSANEVAELYNNGNGLFY